MTGMVLCAGCLKSISPAQSTGDMLFANNLNTYGIMFLGFNFTNLSENYTINSSPIDKLRTFNQYASFRA